MTPEREDLWERLHELWCDLSEELGEDIARKWIAIFTKKRPGRPRGSYTPDDKLREGLAEAKRKRRKRAADYWDSFYPEVRELVESCPPPDKNNR
jgi:hypothetical protein